MFTVRLDTRVVTVVKILMKIKMRARKRGEEYADRFCRMLNISIRQFTKGANKSENQFSWEKLVKYQDGLKNKK